MVCDVELRSRQDAESNNRVEGLRIATLAGLPAGADGVSQGSLILRQLVNLFDRPKPWVGFHPSKSLPFLPASIITAMQCSGVGLDAYDVPLGGRCQA